MRVITKTLASGTRKLFIRMSTSEYQEADEDHQGFCTACGEPRDCCEPDAREYPCEACGLNRVFGLEELLCDGVLILVPDAEAAEVEG